MSIILPRKVCYWPGNTRGFSIYAKDIDDQFFVAIGENMILLNTWKSAEKCYGEL